MQKSITLVAAARRIMKSLAVAGLMAAGTALPANAQALGTPVTDVLTVAALPQQKLLNTPAVSSTASNGNGRFVVAYIGGTEQDSLYVQRYAEPATALGPPVVVVSGDPSLGRSAAIAMAANGDFVVSWLVYDESLRENLVKARVFDAAGTPKSEELSVVGISPFSPVLDQRNIVAQAVAVEPLSGDFIIVWQVIKNIRTPRTMYAYYARNHYGVRFFKADGSPKTAALLASNESSKTIFTDFTGNPPIALVRPDGRFAVAWASVSNSAGGTPRVSQLKLRQYTTDGLALGGIQTLAMGNALRAAPQPGFTGFSAGYNRNNELLLTWSGLSYLPRGSDPSQGIEEQVFLARYSKRGTLLAAPTLLTVRKQVSDTGLGNGLSLSPTIEGGAFVSWPDDTDYLIRSQYVSADGTVTGTPFITGHYVQGADRGWAANLSTAVDASNRLIVTSNYVQLQLFQGP